MPPPPPDTHAHTRAHVRARAHTFTHTHTHKHLVCYDLQAGHLGADPTFDPLGIIEENPLGVDYNRQAEVTLDTTAHASVEIFARA